MAAPDLVLDETGLAGSFGGIMVDLPPLELTLYLLLGRLRAHGSGDGFVHWTQVDRREFLEVYKRLPTVTPQQVAEQERDLKSTGGIKAPMQRKFEENKSKINSRLKRALGPASAVYQIHTRPYRGSYKAIGLTVPPDAIRFGPVRRDEAADEEDGELS